jgi:hypothetical protein
MEIFAMILVVFAALLAFWLQKEMTLLQYSGATAAADLRILYSTRVVTPQGVFPAAVHVFNGRIQSVVRSDAPPKNAKVSAGGVRRGIASCPGGGK